MKAARLLLKEPAMKVKVQGIISALKDSFGFVERADVVAEIFFHYSEFDGEVAELIIGDDVEFFIQQRKVCFGQGGGDPSLPSGTVAFEDISSEKYRGIVIKPAGQKQNLKDGQLSGVIDYNIDNDTKDVLFADVEGEISLRKGDTVEFNISTDRRDSLQWAGVISSLKEGFGFIKCRERDLSLFFHFSQLLEQGKMINNGEEMEFTIEQDYHTNKLHVTRIRVLERGTVNVEQDEYEGLIELSEPQKLQESSSGCEDDSTTTPTLFRFAITSLVNKKEPMLVGDKHLHSPLSPHAPNTYINAAALVNHGGLPQMNHVDANPPCTTLFVANLGSRTTEEELKGIFAGMPGYRRLKVLRNKNTTPVCFVEFYDVVTAMQARQLLNGHILRSSETGAMRIEFARNKMAGEGGMLMFAKKDILIES
eukprot:gene19605-21537_t